MNVSVNGSSMVPSCYGGGKCDSWGVSKMVDGRERSIYSLGIVDYATNPYVQLDLGVLRKDVRAVRLVARADSLLSQSQNLSVYLSATTDYLAASSTLCAANITFGALGADASALCPFNFTARYVTVWKNGTDFLSLQEVQPLMDGETDWEMHGYNLPDSRPS